MSTFPRNLARYAGDHPLLLLAKDRLEQVNGVGSL